MEQESRWGDTEHLVSYQRGVYGPVSTFTHSTLGTHSEYYM